MPQHRIPDSDYLRQRALKAIVEASKISAYPDEYISLQALEHTRSYLQTIEKVIEHNALNLKLRLEHEKEFKALFDKARLYVEHYIISMNMAVEREELPPSVRTYYGLDQNTGNLTKIKNEDDLVSEAHRLFEGDTRRMSEGGKYFTNPTIGIVKVWYDKFFEAYSNQKNMSFVKTGEIENIATLRREMDRFIGDTWNAIESNTIELEESDRLAVCKEYGIQYDLCNDDLNNSSFNRDVVKAKNCQATEVFEPESSYEKKNKEPIDNSLQFCFKFPE